MAVKHLVWLYVVAHVKVTCYWLTWNLQNVLTSNENISVQVNLAAEVFRCCIKTTFATDQTVNRVDVHAHCTRWTLNPAVPYQQSPAAGPRPCWGRNRCQGHLCSRSRWPSPKCPGRPSAPSCLWSQTCAACRPGCPELWLKTTDNNQCCNHSRW